LTAELSVVVPAHNEEHVIARTLTTLLASARAGEAEVIVVCNGCSDRTAEVVRALSLPGVSVVSVEKSSKTVALNAGDALVTAFPRFYLDADIPVSIALLRAMAERLREGDVLAVSAATRHVVLTKSPLVRSFFAVWSRLPAACSGLAGTGVIGMSEKARARFAQWPALLADDYYVDSLFDADEKTRYGDGVVELPAPGSAAALIRRRARVRNGNVQARAVGVRTAAATGQGAGLRRLLQQDRRLLLHVPAFVGVTAAARTLAYLDRRRGRYDIWHRDDSRVPGDAT